MSVLVCLDDLMFRSKISATAKAIGISVIFVSGDENTIVQKINDEKPSRIILDLNASRYKPLQLLARIKSSAEIRSIPIIGFLSHVQTDLQKAAAEAGCDTIMPRSKFVQELQSILS